MVFAGIPSSERQICAKEVLESVGLSDRAHHRPNQLSVGQLQRVVIARAIIMQPSLLLADEPTGNLDTYSGQQIMELLESLNANGLTMLVVLWSKNSSSLAV
jgi:putative ABC transport system ATP-binding protein